MRKTVLFGDSLTAGRIGIAYRRYIPLPTEVHGIEGDTWSNIAHRVDRYLKAKKPGRQTTIVIQGGANDILLPYMAKHFPAWKQGQTGPAFNEPSDDAFKKSVQERMERMTTSHPEVMFVLCSIPILGENLDSEPNTIMRRWNESLCAIAESIDKVVWCDITTALEQLVIQAEGNSSYLPESPGDIAKDVQSIGNDEKNAAAVSSQRDLIVTIDGIHPNALGAQTIASAISAVLPW